MIGTRVRVREHHRMTERRGMVGKIVGYYGGADDYVAVEVPSPAGIAGCFGPGTLRRSRLRRRPLVASLSGWDSAK